MAGDCCVFKFLQRSVDRKHLTRFQSENSAFKFLRRNEDGPLKCNLMWLKICDSKHRIFKGKDLARKKWRNNVSMDLFRRLSWTLKKTVISYYSIYLSYVGFSFHFSKKVDS